jgi:putative peptidoglycan lipid II flippase
MAETPSARAHQASFSRRIALLFSPSREHTVTSAAVLLMVATMLARLVGYLRDAYVAYAFGAGPITDAYIAAFTLPDFLLYLAAGGSVSITFISLLTRYLAEGREREAEEAFSTIITVIGIAFAVVLALGELFTPRFIHWWFNRFSADQADLCILLTRILLPQPMFFLLGGVVSAVLQTRRQFLIPALAPIVYTGFIILGGVTLSRQMGISSLAVGATIGSVIGPFLMNAIGARNTGIRYRFRFDTSHPGFRQWLWMSIPLMLGVSVVAADDWILRRFAAASLGDITRLNYAKRLLQVPIGVLGQAVGLASLPFFARLYSEKRMEDFSRTVNNSISRLGAMCLLASSWMMVAALPIVDLAFRRGHFTPADTRETAAYFFWFSISLFFWGVQGLYARGFYAAGDMVRPMTAGTLVTIFSLPVYWYMFRTLGVIGLVFASNMAIFAHTIVLALLLQQRKLAPMSGLDWLELGKSLLAAGVAGALGALIGRSTPYSGDRISVLLSLGLISITWAAAAASMLWLTRSDLLRFSRRLR